MTTLQNLALHKSTKASIEQFIKSDNHALLLTGSKGAGKGSLLLAIAHELGAIREENRIIVKSDETSISINEARMLRSLLNLHQVKSSVLVVIIENAEKLTTEAQNALLKQLEEPTENVYFLLSTHTKHALLPTVISRVAEVRVRRIAEEDLVEFFTNKGYEKSKVIKTLKLANSGAGLSQSILDDLAADYTDHIAKAKLVLGSTQVEKLLLIDSLLKDKQSLPGLFSALERVLEAGFHNALQKKQKVEHWAEKLKSVEESIQALRQNVSARVLLLRLMLQL